ncbi:MAG: hypothetical protein HQM08_01215 [Candidatus Riflebacteria bacterium]|nr:hypothetical protein [Candidatus Riflebacteria bacterium]
MKKHLTISIIKGFPESSRSGFTLLELLITASCVILLMIPTIQIFQTSSRGSLSGMLTIKTTLEARRILKRVHLDLKSISKPISVSQNIECEIGSFLSETSFSGNMEYKFHIFPFSYELNQVIPTSVENSAPRYLNRIIYKLLPNSTNPAFPLKKLIREEIPHPALGSQTKTTVLSERVHFFQIKPLEIHSSQGHNQQYFYITLQLVDSIDKSTLENLSGFTALSRPPGIIIADYTDLVYPEFWCEWFNRSGPNFNWHSYLEGPP